MRKLPRARAALLAVDEHAGALAALARVGRARDPACVGCHVTGFLQPGGWTLPKGESLNPPRPALGDVGCEACHGPGQAHVAAAGNKAHPPGTAAPVPATATATVATATCLGCHTPDVTNGDFDERAFRAAIVGPGHGRPAGALAPGPRPPL